MDCTHIPTALTRTDVVTGAPDVRKEEEKESRESFHSPQALSEIKKKKIMMLNIFHENKAGATNNRRLRRLQSLTGGFC